jgi:small subunit ribosomal protein S8
MSMTDPISDMLTRIRNACKAGHKKVDVPASRVKREIARILAECKLINNYTYVEDSRQGYLRLYLKYDTNEESVIQGLQRVSKPGLRRYVIKKDIPRVLNGLGIAILSTPKGIMTDDESRTAEVGGEVLCYVW